MYNEHAGAPQCITRLPIVYPGEGTPMKRLNQKTIAALQIPSGKDEQTFWDDDFPGCGLRVRAGGSRAWIYQYKIGQQQRKITFGAWPAMTPAQARERAGELQAQVRLGRDPSAEKFQSRARAAE